MGTFETQEVERDPMDYPVVRGERYLAEVQRNTRAVFEAIEQMPDRPAEKAMGELVAYAQAVVDMGSVWKRLSR